MNRIEAIKRQHHAEQHLDMVGTPLVRSPASYDIPGDMERARRQRSCIGRILTAVKERFK